MKNWAIASGIEGSLAAYEAILADIRNQDVDEFYILGDVVGARPDSEKVVQRVTNPRPGELVPQVCHGWWEEQCLILHALKGTGEPTELIDRYGKTVMKQLWDSVSRPTVEWIRSLDFGFFELDCLLIHGSTAGVSDELTPETPPLQMLDRLSRMEANYLFCGRSGLTFQYEIQHGSVITTIKTLDSSPQHQTAAISPRQIIGVGNVGKIPGQATYTLYNPGTNQVQSRTVRYDIAKGFGRT